MDYKQLKVEFINDWKQNASESYMERVLECNKIRAIINSSRAIKNITNINDLFSILQQRNADNARTLEVILDTIGGTPVEEWLIINHRKLSSLLKQHHEDFFNLPLPVKLSYSLSITSVDRTLQLEETKEMLDSMDTYLDYIQKNVGSDWTTFVRALPKITEKELNSIRTRCRVHKYCLSECLQKWKEANKNDPTVYNKRFLIAAAAKCSKEFEDGLIRLIT